MPLFEAKKADFEKMTIGISRIAMIQSKSNLGEN